MGALTIKDTITWIRELVDGGNVEPATETFAVVRTYNISAQLKVVYGGVRGVGRYWSAEMAATITDLTFLWSKRDTDDEDVARLRRNNESSLGVATSCDSIVMKVYCKTSQC